MTNPKTIRRTERVLHNESGPMSQLANLRRPVAGDVPISDVINPLVQEGQLYKVLPDKAVHCFACGHNCTIKPGKRGICRVRYNLDGKLFVPWGYVAALQCDPIEKKPFFHVYPGTDTLTFGMLGCDLHCPYCQNWDISQTMRDANAGRPPQQTTPEQLVQLAQHNGARCVVSSYNEPLITSEWARAIFQAAKAADFPYLYISNGNATREVPEYIRPYTDGYKIDLKTMNDKNYRKLGAVLAHLLQGVRLVYGLGFWLEIETLIVPGFNDSEDEFRDAAQFIASLSPSIPWHVTAFHKDYKMQAPDNTGSRTLMRAAEIGYAEGLHYVYAGNLPGRLEPYEHTYCPVCKETMISRIGYVITDYRLTAEGTCPRCQTHIPGIWPASEDEVMLGTAADLYARVPRAVRW
jgi:pyruvate formate lyase activating enzyme